MLPTRAGRWQMVRQVPRLGFVAETGSFVAMDALSMIFLLFCLASYCSYFLLPYPGSLSSSCSFVCAASHLLLSASTCSFFLVFFASCLISGFLCFYSFSIYSWFLFLGWRFLLCSSTRYASTWFAYLDSLATSGFSLSHCLWPHNLYLYLAWIRKDTGGTADAG